MSLNFNVSAPPTGFRRLNLTMLAARDQADKFTGLPRGTAKPFTYLAAFQAAEPYLGLPTHAFKLMSWLVKQTMNCDWEEGSRPIAWPSARLQQEFLNLSAGRVKALNRALYEAGLFVIRDNEQGKRYGRRGPDNRIIEAYGFDLSPLVQRFDEFIRLAAEAKAERDRMKELRKRITISRRAIRQAGEMLEGLGPLPQGWQRLALETEELVILARRIARSEELALAAKTLGRLKVQAEQWLKEASKPVNPDPVGTENEPHYTNTNLTPDLKDTVIAAEESSRVSRSAPPTPASVPVIPKRGPDKTLKLSVAQLSELAPRLGQYLIRPDASWPEAVDAAGGPLRDELGVSLSLWGEACQLMGREYAALALAIVSTKDPAHFTGSPGAYFAGMVRRAEKGALFLERTLWALREAKWGKMPSRKTH